MNSPPPDRGTKPTGTLWLEAPDWRELDDIAQRPLPWVLWRAGFQSLLAHWMDESVRRNVANVEIICPDRLPEIEAALDGGAYWSREVRFHSSVPASAPLERESMAGMPGIPTNSLPANGAELIRHWLELQLAWLSQRDHSISLDRQLHPRVWVGPRVSIHPSAKLTGPCWIGSQSEVGAGAEIGPGAIIGTHCVIDADASVVHSVVLPDTFVGSKVHLHHMLADGAQLLDAQRGTRVDITDRFMLARLHRGFWQWLTHRRVTS